VGRVACEAFRCLTAALREREGMFNLCGRHADAQTRVREYAFFTKWSIFYRMVKTQYVVV
jgi:hypothetical protein